jgi:uncharacterized protein (DUF849 family)
MINKIHRKAIITEAITGAIRTTAMLPLLPITPRQIFGDIMRAYDAGGTAAAYHARDTRTDRPNAD